MSKSSGQKTHNKKQMKAINDEVKNTSSSSRKQEQEQESYEIQRNRIEKSKINYNKCFFPI